MKVFSQNLWKCYRNLVTKAAKKPSPVKKKKYATGKLFMVYKLNCLPTIGKILAFCVTTAIQKV